MAQARRAARAYAENPKLAGAELMASWRSRAGEYPDTLVSATGSTPPGHRAAG
jgi:hypothetical protein